jgi:hypothetical protein
MHESGLILLQAGANRFCGQAYAYLSRALYFLDRHSGLISAVGLVLAAIGLLLTLRYLILYETELKNQGGLNKNA